MNDDLKKAIIDKVTEIIDKPLRDAKVQIDYHYDEVPLLRYDVTEYILPNRCGKESEVEEGRCR